MLAPFLLALCFAVFAQPPAALADKGTDELVSWIRSKGGHIDPRQEIRNVDPADPTSLRGIFATEDIPEGELLLSLPFDDTIITADADKGDRLDQCGSARALRREMALGRESKFAPYVELLLGQRGTTVGIPNAWTAGGIELLRKVTGENLPPLDNERHITWWMNDCGGDPESDPLGADAALIQVARAVGVSDEDGSYATCMAPYYDLYNHRNGKWENTRPDAMLGEHFKMWARRDIRKGDQIYNSYGIGTPETLRDYGFVEQTPRTFSFEIPGVGTASFGLDEGEDGAPVAAWHNQPDDTRRTLEFLIVELHRLRGVEVWWGENLEEVGKVPDDESGKVLGYMRVLISAIEAATAVLPEYEGEFPDL
uniref:SET domain-containing protein n=1 Tax=Trieres chinensis TaxID=1514140 RepID=A0A7S1Z9M3_TRICV|mmetsp:Transcript_20499/g.41525  ORF Transcript_20499/g.41525 Transcript_20499/m.41525 type:complete len:368 (+) Transcript_20499:34-1137(+)